MADERELLQHAQEVFRGLCKIFDDRGWKYDKDEEKLKIESGTRGDDLPIPFNIYVDAKRQMLSLISHLPFEIPEDKRLEIAIAVSAINYKLLDGCFDYNIGSGNLFFRMNNSIMESDIGEDLLVYLAFYSFQVIDKYNDTLLLLAKGKISIDQFLQSMN